MKHILFLMAFFVMVSTTYPQSKTTKNMDREELKLLKTNFFNRNFKVYSEDKRHIEIIPFYGRTSGKLDMLVKGPVICRKGTLLKLELENGSVVEKVSFNEFNLNGVLFFLPFTENEKMLLIKSKLKCISLIDERETISCPVAEGESDYFIQLMNIDKEKYDLFVYNN